MSNQKDKINFESPKELTKSEKKEFSQILEELESLEASPKPKESDFATHTFRAISADMVIGGYSRKASYFAKEILKAGMNKLVGKPIYLSHWVYNVEEAVGVVEKVEWEDEKIITTEDGTKVIPAGINATLKVDAEANPKLARALAYKKPFIYSVSVTVAFQWKFSHEGVRRWDLGEVDEKSNKMVVRNAQNILDFYEISLVFLGADPYAKMIKDGQPYQIDWSSVVAPEYVPDPTMTIPNPQTETAYTKGEQTEVPMSKKANETSELQFGQEETKKKEKDIESLLLERESLQKAVKQGEVRLANSQKQFTQEIEQFKQKIEKLETENAELSVQVQDLTKEAEERQKTIEKLQKGSENFEKIVEGRRTEATRLYSLSAKGKTEEEKEVMYSLIDKSSFEELAVLVEQFGGKISESLQATCPKCDAEVELRSSKPTENIGGLEKENEDTVADTFNGV